MALGLTQPPTAMSTRNISPGVKWPVRRADNLTPFMCRLSFQAGSLNLLEPSGPLLACNGIALPDYVLSYTSCSVPNLSVL